MGRRNNRKKKGGGFAFPASFAGLVLLIAVLGVGYVWLKCRCEALGRQLKELESDRRTLAEKRTNEKAKWARLKAPENLQRTLAGLGVEMSWPRGDQVVQLLPHEVVFPARRHDGSDPATYARLERGARDE